MKTKLIFIFLLVVSTLTSVQNLHAQFIKGDGNVTRKSRDISGIQKVEIEDGIDLYISQGSTEKLEIEADENLHPFIKTEIENGTLKIYLSKSVWKSKTLNAYLTIKNIDGLSASGGSDVESSTTLKIEELSVICSGGSDANLEIESSKLRFKASGGSDGKLSGKTKVFLGKASGGSDIKAYDLISGDCFIEVDGGSDAEVTVNGNLNASGSGGSDVKYKGNPTAIQSEMSGGSELSKY
ncbi:MAG: head GIN domain-containing protein [Bacteroidales bacterium]